jgi:hypothetical protein
VVGIFTCRTDFDTAVEALLSRGFTRSDLSVLASHDSIDAASPEGRSWKDRLIGLVGELKYEGPLVTAGLIAIAAGEVGAVIAGLIAAGVGGIALKELTGELTARPHSAEFARAIAAGSIVLWVDASDSGREELAMTLLREAGGANVHVHERAG